MVDQTQHLAQSQRALLNRQFIVPVLHDRRVRVQIMGVVHQLIVRHANPGWWVVMAHDADFAFPMREADPWERGDYLNRWPEVRLVLAESIAHQTWLAFPYNPQDAANRLGFTGPLTVHLVDAGQTFERITGRVEGRTVWFDGEDRLANDAIAVQLREQLAENRPYPEIRGLSGGERDAFALVSLRQSTARAVASDRFARMLLNYALRLGGATLVNFVEWHGRFQVSWERDGQQFMTTVDKDLNVIDAGICLSGEDDNFDLTSIVNVMQQSPWYHREPREEQAE